MARRSFFPTRFRNSWKLSFAFRSRTYRSVMRSITSGMRLEGTRTRGKPVGARIVLPLAPEDDLEMRNLAIADVDRHSIEAQIRDVMLAARIEATADLDPQILDGFIQIEGLCGQPRAKLAGETARRRDSQLAGVGARASRDIHDRAGAGCSQANAREFTIEIRKIGFAHPSQHDVLFDGRAHAVAAEASRNTRELTHLPRREIAERQSDRGHDITCLLLAIHIRGIPRLKAFRPLLPVQKRRGLQGLLGVLLPHPRDTRSSEDPAAASYALREQVS